MDSPHKGPVILMVPLMVAQNKLYIKQTVELCDMRRHDDVT